MMDPRNERKIAEKELRALVSKKAKKRRDFYIHLVVYSIGMGFWLLRNYTDVPVNFFPFRFINCFVMGIWTFAIAIQAVELLVSEIIFGRRWEEKKIREMLEGKSEKQTWE